MGWSDLRDYPRHGNPATNWNRKTLGIRGSVPARGEVPILSLQIWKDILSVVQANVADRAHGLAATVTCDRRAAAIAETDEDRRVDIVHGGIREHDVR